MTFLGSLSAVKSKLKEILNESPESEINNVSVEQVSGDPTEKPEHEAIDPVPKPMEQSDVSENVEETAEDKKSNDPVKQVSGDPKEKPENEDIEHMPKPLEESDVFENVEETAEDKKSNDPVKQVPDDPMELGKAINGPETPSIDDESENLWSSMTTLLYCSNPDVPIGNALCTLLTSDRPNF